MKARTTIVLALISAAYLCASDANAKGGNHGHTKGSASTGHHVATHATRVTSSTSPVKTGSAVYVGHTSHNHHAKG